MRATPTFVFDPKSVAALQDALTQIPRKVAIRHLRIGLNAWGGVVRDVARQHVREETGLLKKSLGVKVTIPDASFNVAHHGKPAHVIVGPARKSGRMMRRRKGELKTYARAQRALKANRTTQAILLAAPLARERMAVKTTLDTYSDATYRNPTRYAHLVEKGTSHSRAYPFIAPAVKAGETVGMEKLTTKIRQGLEQEAAKYAIK